MRRIIVALCLVVTLVPGLGQAAPVAGAPVIDAGGSVNQVYATGLTPGAEVELQRDGATLRTATADPAGAHLFQEVTAGDGYAVASEGTVVEDLVVTDPSDHPDDAWYAEQAATDPLAAGYGYLETRDGTTLSVSVNFPVDGSPGPWPVLVNYSGYSPSQPGSPPPESVLYLAQGYVVVGVNMRGTGCSGGAFSFMETLQSTDGYDVIETLAHQPWSNGDVGMVGVSYSGYSQLYVAATQPPHLRAITPLSPYSDTYSAILYPGGILNNGFALEWATDRENGAKPRAAGWARTRIDNGDTICERNQDLRLQSQKLLELIYSTPFAETIFEYLNTETFVDQIQVPTYLASQWQDEQTGGSAANLIPLFDPSTKVFASFTNGTHVEPMAPSEVVHALAFIDIYVGKRVPHLSPLVAGAGPAALSGIFGSSDVASFAIPPVPFADAADLASARAAWEAQPRVRVKWENGAAPGQEGLPLGVAESRHTAWPPSGLQAEALYLQPDGALAPQVAAVPDGVGRAHTAYLYDRTSKRERMLPGGGQEDAWVPHPDYEWDSLDEDHSLSFLTEPFASDVAYAGQGSVDLWLRSSEGDTDLEVTLTEVRPDGQEVFIQSGWLRASHRALDLAKSTELVPFHTHQAADAAPLPTGVFTPVRIELFPFAHVIREGSHLRVNVEVPGGNQPFWAFDALAGTPLNEIGHSLGYRSRVVLPRVPDAQSPVMPEALPACELAGVTTQAVSLRNQPCRPYEPARRPTRVVAGANAVRDAFEVRWTPPPGEQPTGYRVLAVRLGGADGGADPAPVDVPGDQTTVTIEAPDDVLYEFRVIPLYGDDQGPVSDASLPAILRVDGPVRPDGPTSTTSTTSTSTPTSVPGSSTSTPGSTVVTSTSLGEVTTTTLAVITSTTVGPPTTATSTPGTGAGGGRGEPRPAEPARPRPGRPVYTG